MGFLIYRIYVFDKQVPAMKKNIQFILKLKKTDMETLKFLREVYGEEGTIA